MYLYSATGNWLLLAPYNLVALFPHSSRQYTYVGTYTYTCFWVMHTGENPV